MICRYVSLQALFCAALVCLVASWDVAIAQESVPETNDRFLALIQPRSIDEIQRDIDSADQARATAVESERTAQDQRNSTAARLEDKKQAIAINKDKHKAAKQERNESQILVLASEGKALERDRKLLEERQALREAEIELARMRNELATLSRQALDLERQLALKRSQTPNTVVSGPDSAREARLLIDLEKGILQAQKRVAEKQGEVADGAKKVIDRQLKTLEAQQNIYGGK